MSTMPGNEFEDSALDHAVRGRLAKLSHMPVDTGGLERALAGRIPAPLPEASAGKNVIGRIGLSWGRVVRPLAAVAASLLFVAIVATALLSGQQVRASDMAQMHRDIVAGKIDTMKVDSVDQAREAFAAFADGKTGLPESTKAPPMECCMKDVAGKKVFCLLLNNGGTKVTMAVADCDACKALEGDQVTRNGETFHIMSFGELNMLSFNHGSHRICLIGQMPTPQLMDLTDGLKF